VTKPELGTKRLCASCSAKYYDLNKTPITCPKCGTLFAVVHVTTRPPRPDQRTAARKAEVETEEAQEAKFIPLEEAEAEAQGRRPPAEAEGMEATEDAETDETTEDDGEAPFIEVEEDEDVSDIIGGDVEDEEET